MATGFGFFSGSEKSGEKDLTAATSSLIWPSERCFQAGIEVYGMPSRMTCSRSSSVGRAPLGVCRILNLPAVKSRGRGSRRGAANPKPSPFSPWHWEQSFW